MKFIYQGAAIVFLLLLSMNVQSQSLPNSFRIGDYVEVYDDNQMLVYMNCTGAIVDKKCASFYRVGKMDSTLINFSGEISDYYLSGEVALKASVSNNFLNGKAVYYHQNGSVRSSGNYKQNLKTDLWTYYYSNGQKEKVINYVNGQPLIIEYYTKSGKQKVADGAGEYSGEFYGYKACTPFAIQGKVKDGKMDGKWAMYNSTYKQFLGNEYFNEGQFEKGISGNHTYTDKQRIFINEYLANENVALIENKVSCPVGKGMYELKYQEKGLNQVFYPEVLQSLEGSIGSGAKNQWFVVGLNVNNANELTSVHVKSSINDEVSEKTIYDVIKSKNGFTSAKVEQTSIESDIFFSILIWDGQVIIPSDYIYNNR